MTCIYKKYFIFLIASNKKGFWEQYEVQHDILSQNMLSFCFLHRLFEKVINTVAHFCTTCINMLLYSRKWGPWEDIVVHCRPYSIPLIVYLRGWSNIGPCYNDALILTEHVSSTMYITLCKQIEFLQIWNSIFTIYRLSGPITD